MDYLQNQIVWQLQADAIFDVVRQIWMHIPIGLGFKTRSSAEIERNLSWWNKPHSLVMGWV